MNLALALGAWAPVTGLFEFLLTYVQSTIVTVKKMVSL